VYKQLDKLNEIMVDALHKHDNGEQVAHMAYEIDQLMGRIFDSHSRRIEFVSGEQTLVDLAAELERIKALFSYYLFKNEHRFNLDLVKFAALGEMKDLLLRRVHRYEGQVRRSVEVAILSLSKNVSEDAMVLLRVLDGELKVEQSFDMSLRNWARCVNGGHVYSTSAFGNKCPECKLSAKLRLDGNKVQVAYQAFRNKRLGQF
jgi:hypothetical protein